MIVEDSRKRIVIIGATSAIAEQCARLLAAETGVDMVLVGRNRKKVERVAEDLQVRSPNSTIRVLEANFMEPEAIGQLAESLATEGAIHLVLIAHGSLADQAVCQRDLNACREALAVNGISPVLFAEAFAEHMEKAGSGTLAIIGSVAGDRGRKSNYVYGAAKGLVARYAQGLQHRLANTGVRVVLIKPGPTDTPMTAHLKLQGASLANAADVAKQIVEGIHKGKPVVYAPAKWGPIMAVIKHLPAFIFNRLNI